MRTLFISPMVSRRYMDHVEALARKGWGEARFVARDVKRHERHVKRVFYGLGLLTLASSLPPGIPFAFVDENLEKNDPTPLYEKGDYDLVALTGQVIQRRRMLELMDFFSARGVHVVVGGVHATGFPEDYMRKGASVVVGEGEELFPAFLKDFARGKPLPLYKSSSPAGIDPGRWPSPDYSLLSSYRYNLVGVQTTRGCPYRCDYCQVSRVLGDRYRHKPVERVGEEVRAVKRHWPDAMFYFFDDNLFADRYYALELLENLRDVDLGPWGAHADVSVSRDPELLDRIAANGAPSLAIGFETLSPRNALRLGNPMKSRMLPEYDEAVARLGDKGVRVAGSFMFGFPGDSEEELEEILSFVRRHGIKGYITRYSAIPGSKMYDDLVSDYRKEKGEFSEKGTPLARKINEFFMERNGFGFRETEDMILQALKKAYTHRLPLSQLDALAVFRSFFTE